MPPFIVKLVPDSPVGSKTASRPGENSSGIWRIPHAEGQTLAQAVYLSGCFTPPALCSGLALCGRCRMRVLSPENPLNPTAADRDFFPETELALGWRLGCRHLSRPGLRLELPPEIRPAVPAPDAPSSTSDMSAPLAGKTPGDSASETASFALAVDLGTTSLEWALFWPRASKDGAPDPELWHSACVNPQMGAGSDVLSRLAYARTSEKRAALHRLTVDALRGILAQGRERARQHVPNAAITQICLAGNPAMTALALNLDTEGLAAAPYSLPERGGRWADLPGLPPLWIPPQLSPFAGGDITAGYAALALDPAKTTPAYPFLLADMGTNGEFLLALSPDKALAASVALGPALEGSGLRMGSEARPGTVAGFGLRPGGIKAHVLTDETETAAPSNAPEAREANPRGITGTGYIALLHLLLQGGVIDEQGHFRDRATGPLRNLLPAERNARGEASLRLPLGLRLYASDIEELLKVKAAFSLGVRRLLAAAGLASRDLRRVCLAGALGRHVDKKALEGLGFFPPGMDGRLHDSGNSSLAGAELLLRHPPARDDLRAWAVHVETVDLASDPAFTAAFAEHMRFRW